VKPSRFTYLAPTSIDEVARVLDAHGDDAKVLAGGQSLVPMLNLRLAAPEVLVDLNRVPGLDYIRAEGDVLAIGAMTRHRTVVTSALVADRLPLLARAASVIGYPAIRNRGTFGGSVALADPASEFPAMTLALDAEIEIVGPSGRRRVKADDFFIDLFETALEPGELITAIYVPLLKADQRFAFDELARRRGDYALVGCGIMATCTGERVDDIRISFFSVGNTPTRVKGVEGALIGARLDAERIAAAQGALEGDLVPPESDEVPPAMRLHLARVLLGRLLGRLGAGA
jgi:carbon-monoxide dehydrogenase medium subunit